MPNPEKEPFPVVHQHLVDALREVFPLRAPTTGRSIREYDEDVGVERVLAFLARQAKQNTRRR